MAGENQERAEPVTPQHLQNYVPKTHLGSSHVVKKPERTFQREDNRSSASTTTSDGILRKITKKEKIRKDALENLSPSSCDQKHNEREWKIIAGPKEEALSPNLRTLAIHVLHIDYLTFQIVTNRKYCALFGNSTSQSILTVDEQDRVRQDFIGIDKMRNDFHRNCLVSKVSLEFLAQAEEILMSNIKCPTKCNYGKELDASQKAIELADKLEDLAMRLVLHLRHAAESGLLADEIYKGIVQRMEKINRLSEVLQVNRWENIDERQSETLNWSQTRKQIDAIREHALSLERASQQHTQEFKANVGKTSEWTSTLTALTGIIVLLAFLPAVFAWARSDDKPGSPNDADFWWILQSSIMQLLGIFTLSVPIYQNEELSSQNKWWTLLFVVIAATSTVVAVPLDVLVPVGYSSILAFVANVAQAFVVLQLALASQLIVEKRKEKMS